MMWLRARDALLGTLALSAGLCSACETPRSATVLVIVPNAGGGRDQVQRPREATRSKIERPFDFEIPAGFTEETEQNFSEGGESTPQLTVRFGRGTIEEWRTRGSSVESSAQEKTITLAGLQGYDRIAKMATIVSNSEVLACRAAANLGDGRILEIDSVLALRPSGPTDCSAFEEICSSVTRAGAQPTSPTPPTMTRRRVGISFDVDVPKNLSPRSLSTLESMTSPDVIELGVMPKDYLTDDGCEPAAQGPTVDGRRATTRRCTQLSFDKKIDAIRWQARATSPQGEDIVVQGVAVGPGAAAREADLLRGWKAVMASIRWVD